MFRDTQSHGNANALSRLPLSTGAPKDELPPELVLLMEHMANSPITAHTDSYRDCMRSFTTACPTGGAVWLAGEMS